MLILRLMKRCQNSCLFCMVRDEMASCQDLSMEEIEKAILQQDRGSVINFFGGEPTLYPRFTEALSCAKRHGCSSIVATNGRRFADKTFLEETIVSGISHIRTSLYGGTPEVHDYHTDSVGSFIETVAGIRNIVEKGIDVLVNYVITALNFTEIESTADVIMALGVRHMKFSSLIKAMNCLEFVPSNRVVRPYLIKALEKCRINGLKMEIEKSPLCLASEYCQCCIIEPQDAELYARHEECQACYVKTLCPGLPVEQLVMYSHEEGLVLPFAEGENGVDRLLGKQGPVPDDVLGLGV
jgi:MoaA/NifB/PqqE/SkfB family radical SAM enzyme